MNSDLFMNAANIATTPRDMLVEALHPGVFSRNEDLENFITKTTRYFDASGITKPMRSILVVGLLERSLRNKYEDTENNEDCKSFEERLRKAFGRHRSLLQELEFAIRFRRRNEDTESYEKKIDAMVEKLLRYRWDKQTLKKELLIHCCEDKEIKREIKMREYESSEQITAIMKKSQHHQKLNRAGAF